MCSVVLVTKSGVIDSQGDRQRPHIACNNPSGDQQLESTSKQCLQMNLSFHRNCATRLIADVPLFSDFKGIASILLWCIAWDEHRGDKTDCNGVRYQVFMPNKKCTLSIKLRAGRIRYSCYFCTFIETLQSSDERQMRCHETFESRIWAGNWIGQPPMRRLTRTKARVLNFYNLKKFYTGLLVHVYERAYACTYT